MRGNKPSIVVAAPAVFRFLEATFLASEKIATQGVILAHIW
jgi:hypothetical protein